jgi:dephospho-CoA kinase
MIIGVTSLAGGGKDTFAQYLESNYSFYKFNMSDILGVELKKLGQEDNKDNRSHLGVELREKHGKDIVLRMVLDHIKGYDKVVLTGMRSPEEVDTIRSHYPSFVLVAIDTDIKKRWKRRMPDDPPTLESFIARDERDIKHMGLGEVMKMANYRLSNESDLNSFHKYIDSLMRKL